MATVVGNRRLRQDQDGGVAKSLLKASGIPLIVCSPGKTEMGVDFRTGEFSSASMVR